LTSNFHKEVSSMRETHDKRQGHQGGLDRIAIAWAIQLAVIAWIVLGAVGQLPERCSADQVRVQCRTTQGDVGLPIPSWLGH
jgi:hypothetical protein